jgi:hypothetical protein
MEPMDICDSRNVMTRCHQATKLEQWSVFHISLCLSLPPNTGENACPHEPTYLESDKIARVKKNAPTKKKGEEKDEKERGDALLGPL